MTKMRLRVGWVMEDISSVSFDIERGYAWELAPLRNNVSFPHIYGREGFKTIEAARKDAHAWAGRHNIAIAKKEEICK